jgi:Arf/Sar family protein|tara:strand:- start:314 stop:598 length:285 start_codon:yes stop_codon:yes gene_type:complete
VVIFVVDVSDPSKLPTAQAELSVLLANDAINHIPFLILGNKIDVNPHLNEVELIQGLLLTDVVKTPWIVMPISAIKSVGIESVIEWLVNVGKNT